MNKTEMKDSQRRRIGAKIHKHQNEIQQFCQAYKRIHLYGLGFAANMIHEYLIEEDIRICDVIVGDGYKETDFFKEKYNVLEISQTDLNEDDGIILCTKPVRQKEIRDELKRHGLKDTQIYGQRIYLNSSLPELMDYSCIKNIDAEGKEYFFQYSDLDNLGKLAGTDKCSLCHNYLKKYEFFLNKWRQKEIVLLELGVFKGASLKMWGDFFKKAVVYGVDSNPDCAKYESENCKVMIGDLGSEDFLDEIGSLSPTVIIDDASHFWSHQIKAIYHLLPVLKSGGIFIMEDLQVCFSSYRYMNYDDATVSTYDFCSALSEAVSSREYLRESNLAVNLFPLKRVIEELAQQIEMISFVYGSCIIVKR